MIKFILSFGLTFNLWAQTEILPPDEALQLRQELDLILSERKVESTIRESAPEPKRPKRQMAVTSSQDSSLEDRYFQDEVTFKRSGVEKKMAPNKVRFKRSRMDGNLPQAQSKLETEGSQGQQ